MTEAVRWTIKVSQETDLALRGFLGAQGMKKGCLPSTLTEARESSLPRSWRNSSSALEVQLERTFFS
jgi:hypothetical protein